MQLGNYRHYKGGMYVVIGVAKHSETQEELVIYRDDNTKLWARPQQMFNEMIEVDGKIIARFMYVQQ